MAKEFEELPKLNAGQEYAIVINSPLILNAYTATALNEYEQPGFIQSEYYALVRGLGGAEELQIIHAHRMSEQLLDNLKRKCAKEDPHAVVKVIGTLDSAKDIIGSTRQSHDVCRDRLHPVMNCDEAERHARLRKIMKAEQQNAMGLLAHHTAPLISPPVLLSCRRLSQYKT